MTGAKCLSNLSKDLCHVSLFRLHHDSFVYCVLSQDMIVSILPGGQPGGAWRHPHPRVALAMRLSIFAVGGVTAYAVSLSDCVCL